MQGTKIIASHEQWTRLVKNKSFHRTMVATDQVTKYY